MAACRSCGASIRWVEILPSRKLTPLDITPTANGNLMIVDGHQAQDGTPIARVVTPLERTASTTLYTSHFATCPNAAQHRTPKLPGLS